MDFHSHMGRLWEWGPISQRGPQKNPMGFLRKRECHGKSLKLMFCSDGCGVNSEFSLLGTTVGWKKRR